MITETLKKELDLEYWQVKKVIALIDEGNTIPFIARYRKDVTGSLNDEILRKFDERLKYLRNLEEKKSKIIKKISELGQLTDELESKILKAETLVELEDLYRPYKSKKNTRASIAKEKGLKPVRFHDLRHSCASLLLANGVPMKMIQDWLGHSDMGTTANIYSHIDSESKKASAMAIGTALG